MAISLLLAAIIATFIHRPFRGVYPEKEALNKERDSLKEYWNGCEAQHDLMLKDSLITISYYFEQKDINEQARKDDFNNLSSRRKAKIRAFKFNGRSSLKFWLFIFGTHFMLLVASCWLANKDVRLKELGMLKWYEPHAAVAFIAVSLFWMYHTIFQTTKDFKLTYYTLALVLAVIPLSYFIYHSIRRVFGIEEKLQENLQAAVNLLLKAADKYPQLHDEIWNLLDKNSKNGR